MTTILTALLMATQAIAPAVPTHDQWAALPLLPLAATPADLAGAARFVMEEAAAGRCSAVGETGGTATVRVAAVVLLGADGRASAVRPHAIGCATVEQYAVGILQKLVERGAPARRAARPGWYRTGLTFTWTPASPRAQ